MKTVKTIAKVAAGCAVMGAQAYAALTVPSTSFQLRQNAADGNLYVQGEVGTYVNIPQSGSYTVTLQAAGTPAAGVYPLVGLSINGLETTPQTIDGTVWGSYTYTAQLSAGVQKVAFFLNNDLNNGTEDRNCFINQMTITQPAGAANPVNADYASWVAAAQARENQAVADTAAAIDTYRKGGVTLTVKNTQGQVLSGATVTVNQLSHQFRFGASLAGYNAYNNTTLNNAYLAKFKQIFNYATLPMYWSVMEPAQGQPSYAWMDAMTQWAAQNNISMKGHGLLYNLAAAKPSWMTALPTVQQQLDHVSMLMQRYGNLVNTWEVVNEPFSAPGMDQTSANAQAKLQFPGASLSVNEFGEFYNGYPELYSYLQGQVAAGTKMDVIGLQGHAPLDMAFPMDRVRDVLSQYATLGKSIHITEFTPSSGGYAVQGSPWRTVWDEATQADYTDKFYRVCFANPAVDAISWWDVSDAGSWCPQGGLLRADMSAKPSYDKLNNLINTEWHTTANGSADANGNYNYRGFYGKYQVTVNVNGVQSTATIDVTKGGANAYTITVDAPAVQQTQAAPAPAVTVNTLKTKNTKPTLTGTVSNATAVKIVVNGLTYNATVSNGTWTVTLTTALVGGTYNVAATATGNSQTATDSTTNELIIDTTVPVITLSGSASISIKKGTTYTDAGATATDNIDGTLTSSIVKTSTVNTAVAGTYYVYYNVTDGAGNAAAQKTRTVKVTL